MQGRLSGDASVYRRNLTLLRVYRTLLMPPKRLGYCVVARSPIQESQLSARLEKPIDTLGGSAVIAKDPGNLADDDEPAASGLIAHIQSVMEHQKALLARELHDELGGFHKLQIPCSKIQTGSRSSAVGHVTPCAPFVRAHKAARAE